MAYQQPQTNHDDTIAQIAIAYVSNNTLRVDEVGTLLQTIRKGLIPTDDVAEEVIEQTFNPLPTWKGTAPRQLTPQEIKRSITGDLIYCFEDGKGYKMLKRPLREKYGLSPEEYRRKWGLPKDYPMTAPDYTAERSKLAVATGLGRKG